MQMGIHAGELKKALSAATKLFVYDFGGLQWSIEDELNGMECKILNDVDQIVDQLIQILKPGDNVILLSNGGFGGLSAKLIKRLEA
jgi:UDP-N-acetylmuramate: L-alanyl-gamma-D-glutamyl-meso-diaminopimelate ligase